MADTATRQEVRAVAKWVRTSPRKARLVVEHIRGRSVPEARTVLAFTTRAAARDVEKVLRSAIANAEANHGLVGDDLYVSEAFVDEGPTLKRWRARARGRAARIHKHTCHITVKVAPIAADVTRAAKPAAPKTPTAAKPATTEKPARRPRSATKPKAPQGEEPQVADQKAEAAQPAEPPAAEKPKRTRVPRRKKTEEAEG
jgi:large subunit ribosomal protein L22